MKFLGDIPISRRTLQHLKNQGYDAVAAGERLAPTASDAEILRLAASEGRVILCFDLGFAELVALSGEKLPSLITFRTTRQQPDFINNRLDEVLPEIMEDLERGALATVEDHRVACGHCSSSAHHPKTEHGEGVMSRRAISGLIAATTI